MQVVNIVCKDFRFILWSYNVYCNMFKYGKFLSYSKPHHFTVSIIDCLLLGLTIPGSRSILSPGLNPGISGSRSVIVCYSSSGWLLNTWTNFDNNMFSRFQLFVFNCFMVIQCDTKLFTIFIFYNTYSRGYKKVIRTLARFTESFVFYSIEFFPDIRKFHTGYKNIILENGCHIPFVFMPVIVTCS